MLWVDLIVVGGPNRPRRNRFSISTRFYKRLGKTEPEPVQCVIQSYNDVPLFGEIMSTVFDPMEPFVADDQSLPENEPSRAAASRTNPERSLELALAAARTAAENGATDITVLDMSAHTAIFDYFMIATGTSRRQLHAISEEIDDKLEGELKDKRMNIDGYDDSRWIVLDYGTVVVHLFDEETRQFYSLEALWGDAAPVDLTETLADIRR